eukprot:Em0003g1619a
MQIVAVDIVGPISPSTTGNTYILVASDYFTSVHASTGFSPFYLMFGRQAKLPLDIVYGSVPTEPELHHQYAKKLKQTLECAYSAACQQACRDPQWKEQKRPIMKRYTGMHSSGEEDIVCCTARSRLRVVVHFDRLKRCPQDIRLGTPPAAVSRAHTIVANQPSGGWTGGTAGYELAVF